MKKIPMEKASFRNARDHLNAVKRESLDNLFLFK
jgi:hypothetical protein